MSLIYEKVLIGQSGTNLQKLAPKYNQITNIQRCQIFNLYFSLGYFVIGALTLPEQLLL